MTTPGIQRLRSQAIEQDLCTFCGACSGLCSYIKPYKGKMQMIEPCTVTESRCVDFCPRTGVDLDQVSNGMFGVPYDDKPMGQVRRVVMARGASEAVRERAQYGGTITALISYALDNELIKGAVMAKSTDWTPTGQFVRTSAEALACRGSNYLAAPLLETFNKLPVDTGKVAVVGMPCQMLALGNMRVSQYAQRSNINQLGLSIGLFCAWALSYSFLKKLLDTAPASRISKLDIPSKAKNVFAVYTEDEEIHLPLEEVRSYVPTACNLCHDMTAEMCDLSVGSARRVPGWNTVIIRTERGEEFFNKAAAAGAVEVGELPADSLEHLGEASMIKKRRALRRLIERTNNNEDFLYIKMSSATSQRLLEG